MPTVNIYLKGADGAEFSDTIISELREFIAVQLTCDARKLRSGEVSIRLINVAGGTLIAPLEVEIKAHSYAERASQQDEICRVVATWIRERMPAFPSAHVWLVLCELGHSWEG